MVLIDELIEHCSNNDLKKYMKCIEYQHMIPTKECLDAAAGFSDGNTYMKLDNTIMLTDILNHKVIPDEDTFNALYKTCVFGDALFVKRFDILTTFGLKVSLDMIEKCIRENIIIDDLSKYDIPYDDKLYYICWKNEIIPSIYLDKFECGGYIIKLREMCRSKPTKLNTIIKYMKNNNIHPDRYCYVNACKNSKNDLIDFFIKNNCDPIPQCIILDGSHIKHVQGYKDYNNNIKIRDYMISKLDHTIYSKPYDHIDLSKL